MEFKAVTHNTTHIVFPIFNQMTHLDFTGPHAIFGSVSDARITVASVDCGPRVPSSGSFVRLPAPETLNDS
jgi:hypothetical protein